jgi:cytochrome c peroxidase
MLLSMSRRFMLGPGLAAAVVAACSGAPPDDVPERSAATSGALTAQDRLIACDADPRIIAGLVSRNVCAGADIFFRETFSGNGRTCASCHPVNHNFTLDVAFIADLHNSQPSDPLFVFETNPNLSQLETVDLRGAAVILENVDGFEDPTHKFVERSVPHVFSLATSIARDPRDGTTNPPTDRTGWGGDGAPGDGTLRSFLTGAIIQHYPKTLARRPGIDFRMPTSLELDLVNAFQLSIGRLNELDLTQVNIFDPDADEGKRAFLDPMRGRCNVCHKNAGANFDETGLNRNFDTGIRFAGNDPRRVVTVFDGVALVDCGFGGRGIASPNIDGDGAGVDNCFGNGTFFNPPPLIEAADTPPFFHNNFQSNSDVPPSIENAVAFYASVEFAESLGAKTLEARFGTPLNLLPLDAADIARFLRALNGAFNLDLAKQRLDAANVLVTRFRDFRADIQKRLMQLAVNEIDDALKDIADVNMYPVAQDRIGLAKQEIAAGLAATTFSERQNRISNGISRVLNARDQFGSNINFRLGQGNLMF